MEIGIKTTFYNLKREAAFSFDLSRLTKKDHVILMPDYIISKKLQVMNNKKGCIIATFLRSISAIFFYILPAYKAAISEADKAVPYNRTWSMAPAKPAIHVLFE